MGKACASAKSMCNIPGLVMNSHGSWLVQAAGNGVFTPMRYLSHVPSPALVSVCWLANSTDTIPSY